MKMFNTTPLDLEAAKLIVWTSISIAFNIQQVKHAFYHIAKFLRFVFQTESKLMI